MNYFFKILEDILLKKSGGTMYEDMEFKSQFSSYMLIRYLSMRNDLFKYAEILNSFQSRLSPEQMYTWCYNNIPKSKNKYIRYISKNKKTK